MGLLSATEVLVREISIGSALKIRAVLIWFCKAVPVFSAIAWAMVLLLLRTSLISCLVSPNATFSTLANCSSRDAIGKVLAKSSRLWLAAAIIWASPCTRLVFPDGIAAPLVMIDSKWVGLVKSKGKPVWIRFAIAPTTLSRIWLGEALEKCETMVAAWLIKMATWVWAT